MMWQWYIGIWYKTWQMVKTPFRTPISLSYSKKGSPFTSNFMFFIFYKCRFVNYLFSFRLYTFPSLLFHLHIIYYCIKSRHLKLNAKGFRSWFTPIGTRKKTSVKNQIDSICRHSNRFQFYLPIPLPNSNSKTVLNKWTRTTNGERTILWFYLFACFWLRL